MNSNETVVRRDLVGPDLDVFEVGAGGVKRPLKTPKEEQAEFEREVEGDTRRRDQIIDEFMADQPTNQNTTHDDPGLDADEQFRMERAAYKLITEFKDAVIKRLSGLGFRTKGMLPDGNGNGYIIYCLDPEGRSFEVALRTEDTQNAFYKYGESMGLKLVDLVTERLLAARKRYFERMGEQPGLITL